MFIYSIKRIGILVTCLMIMSTISALNKTKKLQVMINPMGVGFAFYLNTGSSIVTSPTASRPAGSYFLENGLIFPGGTINTNQMSFSVDKHGNSLSASNSLGKFQRFEKMLVTIDNIIFPPMDTRVTMSEWGFYFNERCHHKSNNIYMLGSALMGTPQFNEVFYNFSLGMVGGTGCNENNNSVTAKLYVAPDGTALINLKFSEDIKYD